ncbi:MAG TPA: alpha/beta hydrolase [Rhizomicrobium sp.]|nr:alpha/beta hydrolase [Rhizomicrobium sp.]
MVSWRNVAMGFAVAVLSVYVAVFFLLAWFQRDLLFIRGRHADPIAVPYHARTLSEHDGTRLTVREIAPCTKGAPEIVFFYGNAGTLSDFALIGTELHAAGFGVVLASYRGYDGNSGAPTEAGVMDDARAVLAVLPEGHGAVVLWGQSLGTGVAARMASEGRADALILQSPYTAIVDVAARRFPLYPVRLVMEDRFDTLARAKATKIPVLIMHGTEDETVPFDMGEALSRTFPDARFVPILGGSHNLYDAQVLPVAEKWLRENPGLFTYPKP